MKFQPERLEGVNAIAAYTPSSVTVSSGAQATVWSSSVVVPFQGDIVAWPCARFDDLAEGHFEALLALQPELVVIGCGAQHRFVSPRLMRALIQQGIGVECMDTPAACRTYNILVSEHRRVVAALLIG
ncbi:MAG: Mth938-like domain-containing protein [Leptothrix sp. (in: b-proteobacteria)]